MRIVLQRVLQAKAVVQGNVVGEIGKGMVLLIGIGPIDSRDQAKTLAQKCAALRIFDDDQGKMNRSLIDIGGEILAVSQFTLYANTSKGRRPSFTEAAPPEVAEPLFNEFVRILRETGISVATGVFGARMKISLVNDGPVTLILDA